MFYPLIWAGVAVAGLFAVSEVAEDGAVLVEHTADLTKQATKAGALAAGVYLIYTANKKGWL